MCSFQALFESKGNETAESKVGVSEIVFLALLPASNQSRALLENFYLPGETVR